MSSSRGGRAPDPDQDAVSSDDMFRSVIEVESDDELDDMTVTTSGNSRVMPHNLESKLDDLNELIRNFGSSIANIESRLSRIEMNKRVSSANASSETSTSMVKLPADYVHMYRRSPKVVTVGASRIPDNRSEISSRSKLSISESNPDRIIMRKIEPSIGAPRPPDTTTMINPRSKTSAKGYNTKNNLWATALASLLASVMAKYTQVSKETSQIVDPQRMAKAYSQIVGDLYSKAKAAELPPVNSSAAIYLATCF